MKNVSVNPKTLLTKLQEHNPDLDLTGVKAYLFDLLLGDTETSFSKNEFIRGAAINNGR